jgi:hypothetical protein
MADFSPVLAVDLALRRYDDFGVALVSRRANRLDAKLLRLSGNGEPRAAAVADQLAEIARQNAVDVVLLDGTQAWKDEDNGLPHCRVCERAMHTASKTGLPSQCKPRNYLAFTAFSIAVFDAMSLAGFPRLAVHPARHQGRACIETFPYRAWRSLGLSPLPSKARATPADISSRRTLLEERFHLRCESDPSHDELQALVSSLAGIALQDRRTENLLCAGIPPFLRDGTMREGFIVVPKSVINGEKDSVTSPGSTPD